MEPQMGWMNALQDELGRIYGTQEGLRISWTIVPGILGDFRGMLVKAAAGRTVREVYRMEDGRADLKLEGRAVQKGSDRKLLVTKIMLGEKILGENTEGIIVL